jgi:WD40 repeat protein
MNVLETVEGHSGAVTNICMGSDMIYTASTDKTVRCWVLVQINKKNFFFLINEAKRSFAK